MSMGVSDVFEPEQSDLSGITAKDQLHISNFFHKAHISVNEKGKHSSIFK